jgi:hypothetical protein
VLQKGPLFGRFHALGHARSVSQSAALELEQPIGAELDQHQGVTPSASRVRADSETMAIESNPSRDSGLTRPAACADGLGSGRGQ